MKTSLASHTLRRKEGSGYVATLELSPWQKLDVTNQVCALHSSHAVQLRQNMLSGSMSASCYLTLVFDNCVPW